ncbi:MAG: regulatory iron-sulfur-containing complex subunit RicT [candidate division WOR-3 bacterium]
MNYLIEISPYSSFSFLSTIGELENGELVLVKDKIGEDIGKVLSPTQEEEIGVILRRLTETDFAEINKLKKLAEKATTVFTEIKNKARLPIKILDHHLRWDRKIITFYVIRWEKWDYPKIEDELQKEIPLKVRIKEISPRVFAGKVKGLGRCGREVCCATFKKNLPRVSIRSARLQKFFIPAERISGLCGRLLCCLSYEEEIYQEALAKYPPLGSVVKTKMGDGEVIGIDIFHDLILVRIKGQEISLAPSEIL